LQEERLKRAGWPHDGQFVHACLAQIARRGNLTQRRVFCFSEYVLTPPPNQKHHPRRPASIAEGRMRYRHET
jgi:hypothetical protein